MHPFGYPNSMCRLLAPGKNQAAGGICTQKRITLSTDNIRTL